jgi:hypothetical protein
MPWKSKAQAAFMHIHHPEIAKRWDEHTPKGTKLPEHVKKLEHEKTSSLDECFSKLATNIIRRPNNGK